MTRLIKPFKIHLTSGATIPATRREVLEDVEAQLSTLVNISDTITREALAQRLSKIHANIAQLVGAGR